MNSDGVTLIESLVAVALLSIIALSVFSLYATGWTAVGLAAGRERASVLAQQRLEQIKAAAPSIEGLSTQAREPADPVNFPGYSWGVETKELAPGLHQVIVSVYWRHLGGERQLSLVTYIRGHRGQQ